MQTNTSVGWAFRHVTHGWAKQVQPSPPFRAAFFAYLVVHGAGGFAVTSALVPLFPLPCDRCAVFPLPPKQNKQPAFCPAATATEAGAAEAQEKAHMVVRVAGREHESDRTRSTTRTTRTTRGGVVVVGGEIPGLSGAIQNNNFPGGAAPPPPRPSGERRKPCWQRRRRW